MRLIARLLILALCFAFPQAMASPEATSEAADNSGMVASDSQFTLYHLFQFADENPSDPELGTMTREITAGRNASVNLTQYQPGGNLGAHYHTATDEIDYIIQGQANLTLNGEDYPVKSGDLVYIPPFTVHDYEALGNETLQILVVFIPPFDGDRTYV